MIIKLTAPAAPGGHIWMNIRFIAMVERDHGNGSEGSIVTMASGQGVVVRERVEEVLAKVPPAGHHVPGG
jgi:uncharacterized protein YlzI (FlbEa/FlbD family)